MEVLDPNYSGEVDCIYLSEFMARLHHWKQVPMGMGYDGRIIAHTMYLSPYIELKDFFKKYKSPISNDERQIDELQCAKELTRIFKISIASS